MRSSVAVFVLVVLVVALTVVSASASTPLTVDGGWSTFAWSSGPGVDASPTFSLTTAGSTTIQVTDGGVTGDIFEVYVDTLLKLTTNSVVSDISTGNWGDAAWADARLSKGSFVLDTGTYEILIRNIGVPSSYSSGDGNICALSRAVPEPATLLGFGLPMLMFGLGKLRQFRK